MSDTEPGACPFCAWDHPGDTHSKACVIGRHVDFARARGVAEGERRERARVVADLREQAADPTWSRDTRALLTLMADRYERGEHEREGA